MPPYPKKGKHVMFEIYYSLISAGTEKNLTFTGSKNLIQKVFERPREDKDIKNQYEYIFKVMNREKNNLISDYVFDSHKLLIMSLSLGVGCLHE